MSWENNVRRVVPYIAGEQPKKKDVIKLNTNECPYPPAPAVEKMVAQMDANAFRLYPDPDTTSIVTALAEYYRVKPSQVFVGVGSDDVLSLSFLTFFNSGRPILFPDVTYSFYDVWADLYRIPYKTVPLKEDWSIDIEGMKQENGGVIFPNPNAPTGLFTPLDKVEEIIAANRDVVVIVDEAYIDFGGESALPLLEKYDNLLIVQTFSKSRAMAGMRIGFCIGNEKLIGYLNDVKFSFNSYTMNRPAQELGALAVRDEVYFREITGKVIATREWTKKELTRLGFTFPDSRANFVFAEHKSVPAKDILNYLRSQSIFVRYWDKDRINNHLRITIGTDDQMRTLIGALEAYLG
ncbi:MAG: histidinol-phosphate transaminase [Lachnospiraceae bacterium]|nr:histidinol-phosphate transaminase [Lachnospiraceae bacterium]